MRKQISLGMGRMVITDSNSGPAALSSEARLALNDLELAKVHRERGAFEEARALVDGALAMLTARHEDALVETEDYRLRAYASFQRSLCTVRWLKAGGMHMQPGGALSATELRAGVAAASEAVRGYTAHYNATARTTQSEALVRDAQSTHALLAQALRVAEERDGPARRAPPSRGYELNEQRVKLRKLTPMPEETTREHGFAAELTLTLSVTERPWSRAEPAGVWDPARACDREGPFFFLTGPYCAYDNSSNSGDANGDGAWLARYMSQGVAGIDYPPIEYILSCPGCGESTHSLPAAFLSLQYAKFNPQQSMAYHAARRLPYRITNKVLPRCWCLRCVRDVVTPLAASASAAPPPQGGLWPHLRRLPHRLPSFFVATSYVQHPGRALSSFMDGQFIELDGPPLTHRSCMDHVYMSMSARSQRRMGGSLVACPGPENHDGTTLVNNMLVGSEHCGACGLAFGAVARKRCPCGLVSYCSQNCQRACWPAHKATHQRAMERRAQ